MHITFDIEKFKGNPNGLTSILSHLKYANSYLPMPNKEIEAITCTTPSAALKFCRYVNTTTGISAESEKVFLKNASLGIRYLRVVKRKHMLDSEVQRRFWRKVVRKPELALEWGRAWGRLSEEEEEVFVKSMRCAKEYSYYVIKGRFPEKVHQMILLSSFDKLLGYDKRCLEEYIKYSEGK